MTIVRCSTKNCSLRDICYRKTADTLSEEGFDYGISSTHCEGFIYKPHVEEKCQESKTTKES